MEVMVKRAGLILFIPSVIIYGDSALCLAGPARKSAALGQEQTCKQTQDSVIKCGKT